MVPTVPEELFANVSIVKGWVPRPVKPCHEVYAHEARQ
jgi:hypothetical protein